MIVSDVFKVDRFSFRHPDILDVCYFQEVGLEASVYEKTYTAYNRNGLHNDPFDVLKRQDLKTLLVPCCSIFNVAVEYSYELWLRNVYIINGSSFNNIEQYERIPIIRLAKMISVHNQIQLDREVETRNDNRVSNSSSKSRNQIYQSIR